MNSKVCWFRNEGVLSDALKKSWNMAGVSLKCFIEIGKNIPSEVQQLGYTGKCLTEAMLVCT